MRTNKSILVAGMAALLVVDTGFAQQTVSVEEIVVTARKKEESLRDVPLAISAFSADSLERAGIEDMSEVAYHTPGLVFDSFIGQQLSVPTIRGISPVNVLAEDVNTAVFVDGVYISGRQGLNFSMLDIERIEVVKGPQSAMYGRNSFSGAINVITRRPGSEMSGKIKAILGNEGKKELFATISGSLIQDKLAGRLGVAYDEYDGSYDNDNGDDFGGHEYNTLSGSLYFTPSENLEFVWNAYYSDDDINPPAVGFVVPNCETSISRGVNSAYCGEIPDKEDNELSRHPLGIGEEREIFRTSLSIDWETELGILSAITGFNKLDHFSAADYSRDDNPLTYSYITNGTSLENPFVPNAVAIFVPGLNASTATFDTNLIRTDVNSVEEISQEIRFSSPDDRKLRWMLGGFYFKANIDEERQFGATDQLPGDILRVPAFGFAPAFGEVDTGDFFPGLAYPAFFNGINSVYDLQSKETESFSVFASLEYDFTEALTARTEVRHTNEEKWLNVGVRTAVPADIELNDDWDNVTGRVSIDYQLGPETMLYGSVANGTKSGGFDIDGLRDGDSDAVFDEEKNISYELGIKTLLWDGRVSLDMAIYFIDWSDIQLPVFTNDSQARKTVNAGDAESKGIEISLHANLTDKLRAGLGASYTDAEFTDAISAELASFPGFAPDGDISGQEVQRTSPVQINASLSYQSQFNNIFDWYVRGDLLYQNRQYTDPANTAELPSRTIINLRAGFESERWAIELWGKNLTEEDAPSSAFTDVFLNNLVQSEVVFFMPRVVTSHPPLRRFGVSVTYRY